MVATGFRLRDARPDDIPTLTQWDGRDHVIRCSTDDPEATTAFDGIDWAEEIALATELGPRVWQVLIAEIEQPEGQWRSIGAMEVIDPHREPTHYWGDIEENLRAVDIWIGEPDLLGAGWGTRMMRTVLSDIAADPAVTGVVIDPLLSNEAAQRFYRRMGFRDVGPRWFDDDHCLVMRLDFDALGRERFSGAGPS